MFVCVHFKEQAKEAEEKNAELSEAAVNIQSLLKAAYESRFDLGSLLSIVRRFSSRIGKCRIAVAFL